MTQSWASNGCDRPESLSDFTGQDVEAAGSTLGKPTGEERFLLGEGMNEFRVELRNDLPLPANARLPILERSWTSGDCRLTLWSVERDGGWRVVHAMRWPAGAEF